MVRTTSDSPGHAHGLVAGTGPNVATALEDLETEGVRQAQELAGEFDGNERGDAVWQFEIIGVRLVAGPQGSEDAWAAAGTLVSRGATPWSGSYWEQAGA